MKEPVLIEQNDMEDTEETTFQHRKSILNSDRSNRMLLQTLL